MIPYREPRSPQRRLLLSLPLEPINPSHLRTFRRHQSICGEVTTTVTTRVTSTTSVASTTVTSTTAISTTSATSTMILHPALEMQVGMALEEHPVTSLAMIPALDHRAILIASKRISL